MRLLITGFQRFLHHPVNPTEKLVEAVREVGLPGCEVTAEVLPVVYDRSAALVRDLVDRVRPDAVVNFGLAFSTDKLLIEQVALNLDDATSPDADGLVRTGRPIDPAAPVAYRTGLPVPALTAALDSAGIPVGTSRDAGGYICNHVFFAVRHHRPDLVAGFIHVPPFPTEVAGQEGRKGLPFDCLLEAARVIAATLAQSRTDG